MAKPVSPGPTKPAPKASPIVDAVNDSLSTTEDRPLVISANALLANDIDPNPKDASPLKVTGVTNGTGTGGTASFDATTGQITFTPAKDFSGAATFSYSATDGKNGTATATVTVAVGPVNDAPALSNASARSTYTEGGAPVAVASGLTLSDVDDTHLEGAIIWFSNSYPDGYVPSEDHLNFVDQNGITGSSSGSQINLTGTATVAQYEAALRSVTYSNSSTEPTEGRNILISFTTSDGELWSAGLPASSIEVVAVNNPPPPPPAAGAQTVTLELGTDQWGGPVMEGNPGDRQSILRFQVVAITSDGKPLEKDVTFVFNTVDGTAIGAERAGSGADYGTLTDQGGLAGYDMFFLAGRESGVGWALHLGIFADSTFEDDETMTATISSPTNAVLGTSSVGGVILNDDVM